MTLPASGPLDLNRIKIELGMDGLNPPANDLNNGWFRRLAGRGGDRQPISFADFRGKGCRWDGNLTVTNNGGSPSWINSSSYIFSPLFDGQWYYLQMGFNGMSRQYTGTVYTSNSQWWQERRPVWAWNVTTNISYTFYPTETAGEFRAGNIDGNWLRAGTNDRFVLLPVLA
ncbi:hypothetical protein [Burkholderia multivorans]|uniref:hypothetical protein n=1 Tax=Burkholderia multivorans TaxID=87883 RepID=UPI001C2502CC|nr:hypothetical protein [Burkholderia multivorans]ULR75130.1 hypothetical protein JC1_58 [Burkholderia phage JC1]MBU9386644.1 hypothetical protein [Burkholderia multivorans]MBU9437078.1 hypothetical protein [Burkholderia multivorans]MBU9606283.1 hypothetical protein [Burkholderia multivorans]MBU9624842.1 hypothetical protein [Burkholderia multivorans]